MNEIKPVAWSFVQDWREFQGCGQECRLLPNFYWGEDLSLSDRYSPLYDQQAIDTLRAEAESQRVAANHWHQEGNQAHNDAIRWRDRAESSESILEQLRKVLGPSVPKSVTDSGARCEWQMALDILDAAKCGPR